MCRVEQKGALSQRELEHFSGRGLLVPFIHLETAQLRTCSVPSLNMLSHVTNLRTVLSSRPLEPGMAARGVGRVPPGDSDNADGKPESPGTAQWLFHPQEPHSSAPSLAMHSEPIAATGDVSVNTAGDLSTSGT